MIAKEKIENKINIRHNLCMICKTEISGITLIALVVTIVILLILAGITIILLFGENGILERTKNANEEYKIAEAREKLELALADASIEKGTNSKYNQDDFLDELILREIESSKVLGDIAIVDGYAFTLDRSVPKIGEYVGKEEELVFPTVELTTEFASDYKTATLTITAQESENGISKIEIIQNGFVIQEEIFENITEQIVKEYTVKQNGTYLVKVYSTLAVTEKTEVSGLVMGITYTPNGNTEYKKSYSVKVEAAEENEAVKSIKYQWLATIAEPAADTFTESCNNGDTITEESLTGEYYLWTLLETESGKQIIERSEVFYFDNQGPTVTGLTATAASATSFTLTATASDEHSGIAKYEFYVNGQLKETTTAASCTITGVSTSTSISCYVIAYDSLGNASEQKTATAKTKLYTWSRWSATSSTVYKKSVIKSGVQRCYTYNYNNSQGWVITRVGCINSFTFNNTNGQYYLKNGAITAGWTIGINAKIDGCVIMNYSSMCDSWFSCVNIGNGYTSACATNSCIRFYNVDVYGASRSTVYSKGSTQYTDVTSASSSAYPNGGYQNGYWYIYKGLT